MKLAILGGGPAGYAAAATAAHLGADVTLVEDNQLGGNCTMTDAVPSKTLLTTADAMLEISRAESDGVDFMKGFPSVNLRRTLARARAVALHQSRGVRERMDGMSVNVLPGRGRVTGPNTMTVDVEGRDHVLEFDALLVCTGASPFVPPFAHPDGKDMPMEHGMMGHGMAKKMGAGKTPEERQKMAASHRAEMQKHSHEKKGSNE